MEQDNCACSSCKKTFKKDQIEFEDMAENIRISTPGVNVDNGIPKCPYCGYLAFFGFKQAS